MCNHPIHALVGGADGITCAACGRLFKSFAEIEAEKPTAEKPKAKKEKKHE